MGRWPIPQSCSIVQTVDDLDNAEWIAHIDLGGHCVCRPCWHCASAIRTRSHIGLGSMYWSKDGTSDDRGGWQPFSVAGPPGIRSVVSRHREIEGRCAREMGDALCAKSDHPSFEHMRLTVEVLNTERGPVCERQASPHTLYLSGMTGRIGAKGQVVIPKALRDRALLQPGDVVDFKLRDKEIVLVARRSPARLGGRFSKTGMAARLLEDRVIEPR